MVEVKLVKAGAVPGPEEVLHGSCLSDRSGCWVEGLRMGKPGARVLGRKLGTSWRPVPRRAALKCRLAPVLAIGIFPFNLSTVVAAFLPSSFTAGLQECPDELLLVLRERRRDR